MLLHGWCDAICGATEIVQLQWSVDDGFNAKTFRLSTKLRIVTGQEDDWHRRLGSPHRVEESRCHPGARRTVKNQELD
jgi:hypothetical protein